MDKIQKYKNDNYYYYTTSVYDRHFPVNMTEAFTTTTTTILWPLVRDGTQVSRYHKKHSPTHTYQSTEGLDNHN